MTVAEYRQTPETARPQELIFGKLRVADAPAAVHQAAVAAMFLALHEHVSTHRLGTVWFAPLDVVLDVENALVVQPDLLFIAHDRAAVIADKVLGAPDLVIEVLSPRPRIGELDERLQWFAKYGVRECWLVHHLTPQVEVIRCGDRRMISRQLYLEHQTIQSAVLPAFDRTLRSILN